MVSLGLGDTGRQEQQECICVGCSGSDVAGVSDDCGRSGNSFGHSVHVLLGTHSLENPWLSVPAGGDCMGRKGDVG